MKPVFPTLLITLTFCVASTLAMASGNHAAGHDGAAIGQPGVVNKANRTVLVDMNDSMRFLPGNVEVKQGETIRFVITNSGKLKHEFVLGTVAELQAHYEAMKKNPEMEHEDANMITLPAGKKGEVVWQFTTAGKVDFACLQLGHYDAGMHGQVTVAKSSTSRGTSSTLTQ